jgi:1,4-alpha-glucan branching enzyme
VYWYILSTLDLKCEVIIQGYQKFGINRANGVTIFREWAPAAQAAWLIGDFNDWQGSALEKNKFGVWTIELPDTADGMPAIPHKSRVKVRLQHWDGWTIDLVPAWIRCTQMPEGHGSTFDGIHWDPPPTERHVWYIFPYLSAHFWYMQTLNATHRRCYSVRMHVYYPSC